MGCNYGDMLWVKKRSSVDAIVVCHPGWVTGAWPPGGHGSPACAEGKVAALTFGDEQLRSRLQETTVLCRESMLLGLPEKRGFSVERAHIRNKRVKSAASVENTVDPFVLQAFPATGGSAPDAAHCPLGHLDSVGSNKKPTFMQCIADLWVPPLLFALVTVSACALSSNAADSCGQIMTGKIIVIK